MQAVATIPGPHLSRHGDTESAGIGGPLRQDAGHSLRHRVYARLREAILNVDLAPGSAISENDLATSLEVSRTPIREALQRLSGEGLVHVVPQVGTFVARMDLAQVRDALFVREAIECEAILRIPRALPAGELRGLKEIVASHRSAVRGGDLPAILESDEAFHRRLLDLAGLSGAWRHVLETREIHRRIRVLAQPEFGAGRKSATQHAAIVGELAAGRGAQAARALREHIRMNAEFAERIARDHPEYFEPAREAVAPPPSRRGRLAKEP